MPTEKAYRDAANDLLKPVHYVGSKNDLSKLWKIAENEGEVNDLSVSLLLDGITHYPKDKVSLILSAQVKQPSGWLKLCTSRRPELDLQEYVRFNYAKFIL